MKIQNTPERVVRFYVLIHPVSKEVRYVGKTTKRLKDRLRAHRCNKKGHVSNWVKSVLKLGLQPIITEIWQCYESEDWQSIEKLLISEFRHFGYNLCNICEGGEGGSGRKMSEAERLSIIERASVKVFSKCLLTGTVKQHKSHAKAAIYLGVNQCAVTRALNKKSTAKGHLISLTQNFEQSKNSITYTKNKYGKYN